MKKELIPFVVAIAVVLALAVGAILSDDLSVSASQDDVASEPKTGAEGMEFIGHFNGYLEGSNTDKFTYYRDIVTDVMYVCFEEYSKGGMTVMQDPETGLPLTYARYMELAETASKND